MHTTMAAADETTENFAEVMNEALADAARAETERDVLVARVAELEAHITDLEGAEDF
jgi:cell division protein FtsB